MVVRRFYPEIRLAKLVAAPGGQTIAESLQRAAAELELIREDCLRDVDARIARMVELAAAPTNDQADDELHGLANDVLNEGGGFGLTDLAEVAHSLCVFVSGGDRSSAHQRIVTVHVEAMRALRRPQVEGNEAARAAVLAGLRDVVSRHVAAEEPAKASPAA
ncbi:MAG: hypothetical protein AB7O98_12700 [Hyphomonadaceae bacterium]